MFLSSRLVDPTMTPSGHLRPWSRIDADRSLSPDCFRARRMLLTAESGQEETFGGSWEVIAFATVRQELNETRLKVSTSRVMWAAAPLRLESWRKGSNCDEGEPMTGSKKGGFRIGTVGGNASFSAGGDMIAGDKVTQTTTTTIGTSFKQDDDKQKFLQHIEELRATLRELQAKMAEAPGLSQDVKAEITAEVLQQVNVLKKTKDEAAGLPVAKQPPPDILQVIEHGYIPRVRFIAVEYHVCFALTIPPACRLMGLQAGDPYLAMSGLARVWVATKPRHD